MQHSLKKNQIHQSNNFINNKHDTLWSMIDLIDCLIRICGVFYTSAGIEHADYIIHTYNNLSLSLPLVWSYGLTKAKINAGPTRMITWERVGMVVHLWLVDTKYFNRTTRKYNTTECLMTLLGQIIKKTCFSSHYFEK